MLTLDVLPRPPRPIGPSPSRRAVWVTIGVVLTALAALLVAVGLGLGRVSPSGGSTVVFQDLSAGPGYGQVAQVPAGSPAAVRTPAGGLTCDRVYMAAGRGLCMAAVVGPTPGGRLLVLDSAMHVVAEHPLVGIPDRVRISADGRYGAVTVFAPRDPVDDDDGYTARTALIDMADGAVINDLSLFTLKRDGASTAAPGEGLGCVTFTQDSNRFYATLAADGHSYLLSGDVAARTLTVDRDGVDCPSLSPDGTRLGFRKRMSTDPNTPVWRYHVLDLRTGLETPLAETGSVDDQLEWLDNSTVLYGVQDAPHAVYAVPADGSGTPRLFLAAARSPVVLRGPSPFGDAATVNARPQPAAELSTAAVAPTDTPVGTPFTHSITVTDRVADASGVVVEDVLTGPGRPVAATADAAGGAVGGHGCTVVAQEHRARCDLPRLPVGSSWRVTVTVIGDGPGGLTGAVFVSADGVGTGSQVAPLRTTMR